LEPAAKLPRLAPSRARSFLTSLLL
jgi:hypothetical protein